MTTKFNESQIDLAAATLIISQLRATSNLLEQFGLLSSTDSTGLKNINGRICSKLCKLETISKPQALALNIVLNDNDSSTVALMLERLNNESV